jgi:hypothetical protein
LRHSVVDGLRQRGQVTDVGLGGDDPAVERLDLGDRLGEIIGSRQVVRDRVDLVADVDGDDVGAPVMKATLF